MKGGACMRVIFPRDFNLIWYENENARILFRMFITENSIHSMNLDVGLGDPDDDDVEPITEEMALDYYNNKEMQSA